MIAHSRLARENVAAQASPQAALQLPEHHRQKRPHAAHSGPGDAGGRQPRHHPDHRRNGHGQGADRQSAFTRIRRGPISRSCAVNSGSVPADLLESALFGHVKGAFTGAITSRKGYFETANKGTIFFDEIGTISSETQTKLLRVIQEREFMPVGSTETIKVDVRIIAATNAESEEAGGRRQVSRGPVLPAERDQSGAAAAARSQGRHSAAGGAFLNEISAARTKNFWMRKARACCDLSPTPCSS